MSTEEISASTSLQTVPTPARRLVLGKALRFLAARLSEASTYRGITLGLTGLGLYIRPEIAAAVTSIGLGVTGLIGIFFPDADSPPQAE